MEGPLLSPLAASAAAEADTFLALLQDKARTGSRADVVDVVYDTVDTLLLANEHERVRWIIRAFAKHVTVLPVSAYLSLLTITRPWRHLLEEDRADLGKQLYARLTNERSVQEANVMVRGLL